MNQLKLGYSILAICIFSSTVIMAQPERWQQRAEYQMEIDFEVSKHQFKGKQKLTYFNNSPDTLHSVFYHLYFNAFQPGSMMDVRSQTMPDPDPRVGERIAHLKENEIGYHKIMSLTQNGEKLDYEVAGTILEVPLSKAILPGSKTEFEMEFESQVPIQIRRSGRDNLEGIAYSMAQWYPKICEYDYQGWHANPYIGREFYGVWADFDVKITIDKDYTIGGTGYLQNPQEIGHGYEKKGTKVKTKGKTLTWHFKAPNVHDFVWAADPDYTHISFERKDGMVMHFFYQDNEITKQTWPELPKVMDEVFEYVNKRFGQYPYKQYSFIQAGDGGMEYPMATLVSGEGSRGALISVSTHELMHSWYQMMMGTNESLYAWMDEGFTEFAENEAKNHLRSLNLYPGKVRPNPQVPNYQGYYQLVKSGLEEPSSTHSDHYATNMAYSRSAYHKGCVFLAQLGYIIGDDNLSEGILKYYYTWRFKHPNPNDFIRVMEKQSGMELDWYREYFINTTHYIDYQVKSVTDAGDVSTAIVLERLGGMPMPIDVEVTYSDGNKELFNIPLRIMRGHKSKEGGESKFTVLEDWPWTNLVYEFTLPVERSRIKKVQIDPSGRLADLESGNNTVE